MMFKVVEPVLRSAFPILLKIKSAEFFRTLLEDSHADDVKNVAVHVSIKGDAVGVVSADTVRILDTDHAMIVIGYQHDVRTLRQAFLHAVAVTLRCALGPTHRTTDVSIESLFAARQDELDHQNADEKHSTSQLDFFHGEPPEYPQIID
jgi:hypothetical protein